MEELQHNKEEQKFVMPVNGLAAFVSYKLRDGKMYLTHAEVPLALRGQGVGKLLLQNVYEYMKVNNLNGIAVCPYIRLMAQRKPEWQDVIMLN